MTISEIYKTLDRCAEELWQMSRSASRRAMEMRSTFSDFGMRDLYAPTESAEYTDICYDRDFFEEVCGHVQEAVEMLEDEYGDEL